MYGDQFGEFVWGYWGAKEKTEGLWTGNCYKDKRKHC